MLFHYKCISEARQESSDRHILSCVLHPRVTPRAVGDVSLMCFAVNAAKLCFAFQGCSEQCRAGCIHFAVVHLGGLVVFLFRLLSLLLLWLLLIW